MIRMLLSNTFYTKIVNNKGEGNWSGCMSPQPWRVYAFIISMRCKSFSEEFICQKAHLWESPHRAPYFQKYKAIPCVSVQIILFLVHSGNNASGIFAVGSLVFIIGGTVVILVIGCPTGDISGGAAMQFVPTLRLLPTSAVSKSSMARFNL